jgi:hypothetical protein
LSPSLVAQARQGRREGIPAGVVHGVVLATIAGAELGTDAEAGLGLERALEFVAPAINAGSGHIHGGKT